MTKEKFLAGTIFELPVPQYGNIYRYVKPETGNLGHIQSAKRYISLEWNFFADVDWIASERVRVVGYWFTELLTKELLFSDMTEIQIK